MHIEEDWVYAYRLRRGRRWRPPLHGWYVVQPAAPGVRGLLLLDMDAALYATAWTSALEHSEGCSRECFFLPQRCTGFLRDYWSCGGEPTLVFEQRASGRRRVRVDGPLSTLQRVHLRPPPAPPRTLKRHLDLCWSAEMELLRERHPTAEQIGYRFALSWIYNRLEAFSRTRHVYAPAAGGRAYLQAQQEVLDGQDPLARPLCERGRDPAEVAAPRDVMLRRLLCEVRALQVL